MAIIKPTLSILTGTENLGSVFSEQNQINVKFFETNVPLTGTSGRIATNSGGANRIIVIQGAHNGDGFSGADQNAKIAEFIYNIETWLTPGGFPSVQSSTTYTDSFGVSYTVDGVDFTWTRSFDDPNRILYTLLLKEA